MVDESVKNPYLCGDGTVDKYEGVSLNFKTELIPRGHHVYQLLEEGGVRSLLQYDSDAVFSLRTE